MLTWYCVTTVPPPGEPDASVALAVAETVMVGDTIEDDIHGAEAVGMRAVLLDREGRYPGVADRLDDLRELPAALGLHG